MISPCTSMLRRDAAAATEIAAALSDLGVVGSEAAQGGAGGSCGLVGGYELGEKMPSPALSASGPAPDDMESSDVSGVGMPIGSVFMYDLLRGVADEMAVDCTSVASSLGAVDE